MLYQIKIKNIFCDVIQSDQYQNSTGGHAHNTLCRRYFIKQAAHPVHAEDDGYGKNNDRQARAKAIDKGKQQRGFAADGKRYEAAEKQCRGYGAEGKGEYDPQQQRSPAPRGFAAVCLSWEIDRPEKFIGIRSSSTMPVRTSSGPIIFGIYICR